VCCGYSVSGGNETKREGNSQFYNFTRDIDIKWFKIPLSTKGLHVHHIFMLRGYSLGSSVGD